MGSTLSMIFVSIMYLFKKKKKCEKKDCTNYKGFFGYLCLVSKQVKAIIRVPKPVAISKHKHLFEL